MHLEKYVSVLAFNVRSIMSALKLAAQLLCACAIQVLTAGCTVVNRRELRRATETTGAWRLSLRVMVHLGWGWGGVAMVGGSFGSGLLLASYEQINACTPRVKHHWTISTQKELPFKTKKPSNTSNWTVKCYHSSLILFMFQQTPRLSG
jgi:hypothetical protein